MRLRRAKALTEQDRVIWAGYVRLVLPLPGVARPEGAEPVPPPPAPPAPLPPLPVRAVARPMALLAVGSQPPGVDNATWTRFRTGKLSPSRTLDLHGRTAQRAFSALHGFLAAAAAERLRCVEVITGRGSGEAGGVLRREFPLWLNRPDLRPLVLAAAHPHAANTGSVRLLLRRVRDGAAGRDRPGREG